MSFETTQKIFVDTKSNVKSHHAYITDQKFISKVINNFIHNEINDSNIRQQITQKNCFNREEIIKALTNMQITYRTEYTSGNKVNINTDHFKSTLLNSMAKLNNIAIPKNLNQIDGRTIDFVEMIFGAFLRNKNISTNIKNLLLRLQIPVIKTSLLDSNFFYNDQHPARHVLNTISHLGIGIENKDNTVYKTIDLIIEQLLRSFGTKTLSFNTALASLSRLTKIENKKHNQKEAITQKQTMHELARQTVLTELQFQTSDVILPKSIQPLVLSHWSTLMFHRYLQHGKDSVQWVESRKILQYLTHSFTPIKSKEEWIILKTGYTGIVNTVKSLLEGTSQNKEKLFLAIRNLNNAYEKLLEKHKEFQDESNSKDTSAQINNETIYPAEIKLLETASDRKEKIAKTIIRKLPEYIQPGAWFEVFTHTDSPVRRLKLSVIIKENAQLVFVDRKGTRVIAKDAELFLEEIKQKNSRLIADHSIFDHALSQVIGNITRKD